MAVEAARATGKDESFCLDVVQDAMLRVIRSLKPLDSEAALFRWLQRTIRSCAIDRLRAESRRRQREEAVAARERREAIENLEERIAWLRRELEELDESAASMLLMRHRFGWTLSQIGAVFGLNPGAVDGRIRRTLDFLRQRARETYDEQ
jgi:RNA polymerase sigma factor (sigma-70 family)